MPDDDFDFDDETPAAHTSDGAARPNEPATAFDVTAAELQQFVDRYNQIESEISTARDDKKELVAELRGRGFDKKAFDATIKVLKIREDRSKVEARLELREIAKLYLTALGQDDFEDLL
jgi:uncharacterized protein (UPF0335 family)